MSQIEVPPKLQELVRKINRVEEMLATVSSTQRALQDYFIALKSEVTKLVEETRLNNQRQSEAAQADRYREGRPPRGSYSFSAG